jgi:hypothetical protein
MQLKSLMSLCWILPVVWQFIAFILSHQSCLPWDAWISPSGNFVIVPPTL